MTLLIAAKTYITVCGLMGLNITEDFNIDKLVYRTQPTDAQSMRLEAERLKQKANQIEKCDKATRDFLSAVKEAK